MKPDILQDVLNAMQAAEDIGGPEGAEYVSLMTTIAEEALHRIRNFVAYELQTEVPKGYTAEELDKDNPYNQWMNDE